MGVRRRPRPQIAYEGDWDGGDRKPKKRPAEPAPLPEPPVESTPEPEPEPVPADPELKQESDREERGIAVIAVHGVVDSDGDAAWTWLAADGCWSTGSVTLPKGTPLSLSVLAELAAVEHALTEIPSNRNVLIVHATQHAYNVIMDEIPALLAQGKIKEEPSTRGIDDGSVLGMLQRIRYLLAYRASNVDLRWQHVNADRELQEMAVERSVAALLLTSGNPGLTFGPGWNSEAAINYEAAEVFEVEPTDLRTLGRW